MILKTPLFPLSPPSRHTRPLPPLLFLRLLCGLHLLLAALLPPTNSFSNLLIQTSPLQIPFFLFLSGFTTLHTHAPAHLSKSFSTTRFYARRFAQLCPLYLLVTLIHALTLSTTRDAFPLSLLSLLSPYLSRPFVYPQTDAPLLAQTFLPSLLLCYLVFPVLLDLFPRYNTSKPIHLFYAILAFFLTALFQAFWLSHLPSTSESHRQVMLIDLAAYIPFLSHLPSFACGMLLALLFLSHLHQRPTIPSRSLRVCRVFLAAFFFLVSAAFVLPFRLTPPAHDGSQSFLANWIICGALLPPFAALVWTCACLSDHTRTLDVALHPRPQYQHSPPFESVFRFDALTLSHVSSFFFTLYVLAAPVWRSLGLAFCRGGAHRTASRFHEFVCLPSRDATPLPTSSVPWLSWWPWGGGDYDLSLQNAALAAAERLATPTTFVGSGVHPVLYGLVLLIVSMAVWRGVQMPLAALIITMHTRLSEMAEEGRLAGYSSLWIRVAAMLLVDPTHGKPRRNNSHIERLFRVVVYYFAGACFLWFLFRYSLPISFHLTAAKPGWSFCWLPEMVYTCEDDKQHRTLSGILGAFGIGSSVLTSLVDVLRWASCLTLPTMIMNIIGHVVFPRAIWKRLPTIPQMLRQSRKVDEEMPVSADEEMCNEHVNTVDGEEDERYSPASKKLDLNFVIYIRYVTRGSSPRLVANNTRRAAEILVESGISKSMWRVEVVTDNRLDLDLQISDPSVYEIVVPSNYRPPNGALYKARALNYAIKASPATPMDWIVHLDEETRFDVDTVRAILYHCGSETYLTRVAKSQPWPKIGQGPILYGRAMTDESVAGGDIGNGNWLTTLADSGRVSDDCGRYRIQYECGEVWVGMHGSFVVCANCVEQKVTFDHGVEGSIAEDAFFGLLARSQDVRFAWIDALMFEQSPFTFMDFIKQRSRWLVGGLRVVGSSQIPFRLRILMKLLTSLWALMPLTYTALIVSVLFGSNDMEPSAQNQYYYKFLLPLLAALSLWNYVFGFFVTFSARSIGLFRFTVLLYVQMILSPVFGIMEVVAVCYALWNFAKLSVGFHVVEKDSRVVGAERMISGEPIVAEETTRLVPQ